MSANKDRKQLREEVHTLLARSQDVCLRSEQAQKTLDDIQKYLDRMNDQMAEYRRTYCVMNPRSR